LSIFESVEFSKANLINLKCYLNFCQNAFCTQAAITKLTLFFQFIIIFFWFFAKKPQKSIFFVKIFANCEKNLTLFDFLAIFQISFEKNKVTVSFKKHY